MVVKGYGDVRNTREVRKLHALGLIVLVVLFPLVSGVLRAMIDANL